jgi:5-methylthioadenosine/S-adenosylhomocysteine deaminase
MGHSKHSRKGNQRIGADEILIKGAHVITVDAQDSVAKLDIRIRDGIILDIKSRLAPNRNEKVIQAKGLVAIPGLVQAHVHTCQSLTRAQADDMELLDWLESKIWPWEGAMNATDLRNAGRLAMAELLLGGTTSILDMGTVQHTDSLFNVAKDIGIRYTGGKAIMDYGQGYPAGLRENTEEALSESVRLCDKWHQTQGGRLRYAFSPRFALSCTEESMRRSVSEARKRGALLHTHASENAQEVALIRERTGMGNVEYLHSLGFTGPDVLLAHCIWLSARERKIMRDTQTRAVHCPSANLKLASGIAKIPEYMEQGIHLALGADGPGCNNRLDGFTEMRLAALLHKVKSGPSAIPARRALRLATRDGAFALGMDDVGSICVGYRADITLLDLHKPHAYPPTGDLVSRVVYSALPSDVHTVLVDGRIVVAEGKLTTFKVDQILKAAKNSADRLHRKLS